MSGSGLYVGVRGQGLDLHSLRHEREAQEYRGCIDLGDFLVAKAVQGFGLNWFQRCPFLVKLISCEAEELQSMQNIAKYLRKEVVNTWS